MHNPFKKQSPVAPKLKKPRVKKEVKEVIEDRSAFNCLPCGGDGLVSQGTKDVICSECNGTGKV